MRKFSKVVLIAAGVLGVAGIGLSIGGVAMGANLSEIDIQRYYKGPKLKVLDWIVDFDWDEGETGEVEYDTSASGGSDSSAGEASVSGDDEQETDEDADVYTEAVPEKLDIDLAGAELIIREYDSSSVRVEISGDHKDDVKVSTEDGELKIEEDSGRKTWKQGEGNRIVVSCPKELSFDSVSIDVDAGTITLEDDLRADDFIATVGAGTFTNRASVTAGRAEAEVGTGTMSLKGLDAEEIDAECGLGTLKLEVKGSETDYRYRISCGAGSVKVRGSDFSGLGAERETGSPDASRSMQVECGLGTVDVRFEE